ncbi:hypothetical protein NOV72_02359 [Caballeronia novacaledonica]|uniref:Uncharacterized protein n=1 Tax=Caballeronia novacaledonica TaxID=1544861 RepID=A0A2U3I4N9_9BURK|nr:hypothetical protein [Caballeronia novacaledonica]SPB15130.1 hypothetical protein NOV72_02359 [Caballeronia novacaledonica]
MEFQKIASIRAIIAMTMLVLSTAGVAHGFWSTADCITKEESMAIRRAFFSKLPNTEAFAAYAGNGRFKIFTNVAAGAALETEVASLEKEISWLSNLMKNHSRLFSDISQFKSVKFTYVRGRLRGARVSVDNLQSSTRFPKNECVEQVSYDISEGVCAKAQKVNILTFDFTKEKNKVGLAGVELYIYPCDE